MSSLRHAVKLAPNFPLLYYALSNIAMASDRNDESLEWLDKGLAIDPLQDFKEGTMRLVLTLALTKTGAVETANAILDELVASNDENGPGWREDNYVMSTITLARDDRESAIEFALKGLDQSLGKQMGWNLIYQHVAWMKPLLKDPRLVKRIAELEAETLTAGDAVRTMLMEKRTDTG